MHGVNVSAASSHSEVTGRQFQSLDNMRLERKLGEK